MICKCAGVKQVCVSCPDCVPSCDDQSLTDFGLRFESETSSELWTSNQWPTIFSAQRNLKNDLSFGSRFVPRYVMKTHRGSRILAPLILNLSTLYCRGKSFRYPLNRKLCGFWIRSTCFWKGEKAVALAGI